MVFFPGGNFRQDAASSDLYWGEYPVLVVFCFPFSFFYSSVCALLMFDDMCRYFPQVGQIVLVTVNYRLGALSFLVTEWAQGNLGLRDQIMALEWVQSNIAFFGGDSGRVTIFGQSAGIISLPASTHLTPLLHPLHSFFLCLLPLDSIILYNMLME